LTNALEALGEGGIIRVSMRGTSDSAELVIHDSGPGIPDDSRHRVFDLNYSTKVGGTGLGLALARRETERVGGAISAESPPGRGTILRVVLPRIIV
jgi:signal transduction histidine kinase